MQQYLIEKSTCINYWTPNIGFM